MDIRALVEKGFDIASGIAEQAWEDADFKINPTNPTYDPVEETGETTWSFEGTISALEFDNEKMRDGKNVLQKVFMVKLSQLGTTPLQTDTRAEIRKNGLLYGVNKVLVDPVAATAQFIVER